MERSADILDQASDMVHAHAEASINKIRAEAAKPIPTSTTCYQCGEDTTNGARWCDSHCRDRWERPKPWADREDE